MKKSILLITAILLVLISYGQETKKLKVKSSSFKETFYVLKSDESVKHGIYKKEKDNKIKVIGYFEQGIKTGIWKYFTFRGEVAQKYDFTNHQLLFDKFEGTYENNDKSSFSRPPILLGGYGNLYRSIAMIMRYPGLAKRNGTQGKVVLKAKVSKKGELTEIFVHEGIGDGCSQEALRAMKLVETEWLPALTLDGEPTEYIMTIPIVFKLN